MSTAIRRTIYSIEDDIATLEDLLLSDDITDADAEQAIAEFLAMLSSERDAKLEGYAKLILDMDARASARQAEAKRLASSAKALENAATRLKTRLLAYFRDKGWAKRDVGHFRIAVQRSGGVGRLELLRPVEQLPEDVVRYKPEANNALIRERIERGEDVDYAIIHEPGYHLRIT